MLANPKGPVPISRKASHLARLGAQLRANLLPLRGLCFRYGMAVVLTFVAVLVRAALLPLTGPGAPYVLLFGAVLAISYLYGMGPGVFSGALGAFAGPRFFGMGLAAADFHLPWAQMVLFFIESASISYITDGFTHSREAARAQAEELRRSEERYSTAARATLDCIWDWQVTQETVSYSEPIHTVFQYPPAASLVHRSWWTARVHPDDVDRVRRSLEQCFARHERNWTQEYRFRTAAGFYLNLLDRGWVMYDRDKKPERMIGAMQNITHQRDGERVLSEANARLRLVTDAIPALVGYLDCEGKHRFMSAEYERWFNKPRSELLGKTLPEILGPQNASPQLLDNIARGLTGAPLRYELPLYHPIRGDVPASYALVPDFDELGQVRGMVCLVRDISEQKHMEGILRESEEHYRVLAEVVPQIMWEAKPDGQFTYVNSQWQRYADRKPEDAYGMGWLQSIRPAQRDGILQHFVPGKIFEREWDTEIEVRRAKDGSYRWHLLRALALLDSRGGVRKWIGSFVDIHERKQAAQELQTLANFIPQLAWVADADGQISWFNQRWYDYTGASRAQLAGLGWQSVIHPDHREGALLAWQNATQSGNTFERTFPMRSADGEWQWFLMRALPIHDSSGRIHRWFGTNTDIHEQRKVLGRLERAQDDLKTAVRARDQFLSIASHELKTPLTSLQLVAQMAERNLQKNAEKACEEARVRKLVDQTGRSVARLTRLVDDMLDSSRIAMGKLSFKIERFDLTDLVHEVVDRMLPQVQTVGSTIVITHADPAWGNWDRFRIEQVVLNLLTNAIRYGNNSPIHVSVQAQEKQALLRVRDHGPGVAPEHERRIFQQFERATPHSSISGLGLGLFICKEIVERHGGQIGVGTGDRPGATFWVKLPFSPAEELLLPKAAAQKATNLPAAKQLA